ncbi:MAG TPA: M20/M25/M40 family metallo-hydrolase [bacterium]|nr:M20/M25/M40 family metallo-hydrolase [bacterium]
MNELSRVYAHIDEHFDRHLDRVRTFVRQPSISGEGLGMQEMAALVASSIQELGGRSEVVATSGWPVVYGEINAGAPRTMLLYGMYDVQPVVGEEWIVPPFGGETVDDFEGLGPCLVSRGVANQKGPLAGAFNALTSMKAALGRLPVNVKFVIEGEEELGSRHLPEFITAHRERLRADGTFFGHFSQDRTGKPVVWLGVKGIVFIEMTCRGGDWGGPTTRGIHGSQGAWIASPAWRMVRALSTMTGPDERIAMDGFHENVKPPLPEDEEMMSALARTFDPELILRANEVRRFKYDAKGADLLRRYLFDPLLNIDGIAGGHYGSGSKTLLPHEVTVKMDFRLVPDMEPDEVHRKLRAHLRKIGCEDFEVKIEEGYPWARMSPRAPISQAMIRTLRSFGREPEVWPNIGGSAPFYLFHRVLRQPFTMGGMGHGGRQHSPNEYATVEGMRLYEKSVACFVAEFAAIRE